MSQRGGPGNVKKRGHQHHPRNNGTRRRAALEPLPPKRNVKEPDVNITKLSQAPHNSLAPVILSASNTIKQEIVTLSSTKADQIISDIIDLTNCDDEVVVKDMKPFINKGSLKDMKLVDRPEAEGSSQSDQEAEDAEAEELARLRCTSERTEVVAEREIRRRKRRCADYPGLAFGSSIFSSDTLMKFSIIRNELHNIMNTQLKRVCI